MITSCIPLRRRLRAMPKVGGERANTPPSCAREEVPCPAMPPLAAASGPGKESAERCREADSWYSRASLRRRLRAMPELGGKMGGGGRGQSGGGRNYGGNKISASGGRRERMNIFFAHFSNILPSWGPFCPDGRSLCPLSSSGQEKRCFGARLFCACT